MIENVAIIGGGAAGFFTAINLAEKHPNLQISIYEGSNKLLAKVLVSGGGRCNVSNRISIPEELIKNYPRGSQFLLPIFQKFTTTDTVQWFANHGVELKVEDDGRIFPLSNTSQTIYDCLTSSARRLGIKIVKSHRLTNLKYQNDKWQIDFKEGEIEADAVVLATGSNPAIYTMLKNMGINIVTPIPSLFTFNAAQHVQKDLAGLSVSNATVEIREIQGSIQQGPLLVTHWGYSAPAILRQSAWYARELADLSYQFTLIINWNSFDKEALFDELKVHASQFPKEKVLSWKNHGLPKRLWQYLFEYTGIKEYTNWSEIGKKGMLAIIHSLTSYEIKINGKSTHKEEFVTAGGIDLSEIDSTNMALIRFKNLYALGEVINIDAITGGFNFQAAWSEGYITAQNFKY